MENEKKIKIYFDKERAEDMPIYSRKIDYVWCFSANTGQDQEFDSDEGFLSLEDVGKLLNIPIIEIAESLSGFYDIYPKTGSGEWYFSSGRMATKFYELICKLLVKNGYELAN